MSPIVHLLPCHRDVASIPELDSLADAIPHHSAVSHLLGRLVAAYPDHVRCHLDDLIQVAACESIRLAAEEPDLSHFRAYGRLQSAVEKWINDEPMVHASLATEWRRIRTGQEPAHDDGIRADGVWDDLGNYTPTVHDLDPDILDALDTLLDSADEIDRAILTPARPPAHPLATNRQIKDKAIREVRLDRRSVYRATVEFASQHTRTVATKRYRPSLPAAPGCRSVYRPGAAVSTRPQPAIVSISRYCPTIPDAKDFLNRFPPDYEGTVPEVQYRSTADLAEHLGVSPRTVRRHRERLAEQFEKLTGVSLGKKNGKNAKSPRKCVRTR